MDSALLDGALLDGALLDGALLVDEYLKSLDEMEIIAYTIAKSHLGSLFSLEKSNDFLEWLKKR